MSHFTNIKTNLQNLFYLELSLKRLKIEYKRERMKHEVSYNTNLVIPQSNGHEITFCWNGTEYELIVDTSFWKQSCSIESFMEKIVQEYANGLIIGEGEKSGFQPVKYQKNQDGSNTITLERWKQKVS
jgi:hypothetical protein